jgi:hypothetical protein
MNGHVALEAIKDGSQPQDLLPAGVGATQEFVGSALESPRDLVYAVLA